jgi:hypothetical protein
MLIMMLCRAAIQIDGLGGKKLIDRMWAWDDYNIEMSLFGCQCFEVVLLLHAFPQQQDRMTFHLVRLELLIPAECFTG